MVVKQSVVTLVTFFLLLTLYTKIVGPIPFAVTSVSTNKSTTFDVTGQGKVKVTPDSGKVSAGVSTTGATVLQVQNEMNTKINKVTQAIKQVGIDEKDIQTSNYNVNPTYTYANGQQQVTGYGADTNLTVTVLDIQNVNAVIDAATGAGATNVNNLGFDVADKTVAENQAREKAIADAKKKAQTIASIAGFSLGNLVNYAESSNNFPRPLPFMAADSGVAKTNTEIQPGSNEVSITVTLSYDIR